MSIMDLFKSPAPTASNNQPTDNNGAVPTNGAPGKDNLSDPAPTSGQDGKMPGTTNGTENPLDVYKKMFDNANNSSDIQAPSFSIDPKVLTDVSKKMDFTRGVNPELLSKATSGDVNSLLEIIKTVGQNAYRASIEHTTALTDTHLKTRGEFETKRVEDGVRKQLVSANLSSAPNYAHPVVKSELNRIAGQFAAANPDASPQQVAEAAQKYLMDLHSALNPSASTPANNAADETDWTKYLKG